MTLESRLEPYTATSIVGSTERGGSTPITDLVVPEHLDRPVRYLIQRLGSLSTAQLGELAERQRRDMRGRNYKLDDPVDRIELALADFRVAETNYRLDVIQRAEAEMNGGHLVFVGYGNERDTYAAVCDPNPPGEFCLEGPDRGTLEEAVEDGRAHHPGYEPEVRER